MHLRTFTLIPLTIAATFFVAPVSANTARPSASYAYAAQDKSAGDKVEDAAKKTGDAVKSGAKTTAKETKKLFSKSGEEITDAWLITKVKSNFMGEDLLKNSDINVDAKDRAITLKGHVASRAGRDRALAIARKTEGVRTVTNRLVIQP